MDVKKKIELRQASNRNILAAISAMVETYPDLRFHQILQNIDCVILKEVKSGGANPKPASLTCPDLFYEESVDTLDRINESFKKTNNG